MEDKTAYEAFYIVVDIAVCVTAILLYIYITKNSVSIAHRETELAGENTTIISQYILEDGNIGYYDGYNTIYDGTITGSSVVADILSADPELTVYLGNTELNSMRFNGMDFLTYCRYYDAKPLTEMVYSSLEYQRRYDIATDGSIKAVKYIIQ